MYYFKVRKFIRNLVILCFTICSLHKQTKKQRKNRQCTGRKLTAHSLFCLLFIYIFYSVETAINCSPDQKYQFFPTNQLLAGRITNRSQQLYNWHRIKH